MKLLPATADSPDTDDVSAALNLLSESLHAEVQRINSEGRARHGCQFLSEFILSRSGDHQPFLRPGQAGGSLLV